LRVLYADEGGMKQFLKSNGVLLKNFRDYVDQISQRLKAASLTAAAESDRPVVYMRSPRASKEEMARQIQQRDGIPEGLICVLSCVEPCMSYSVVPNRATKELDPSAENCGCCGRIG
jgi:hypothetical protein